MTFDSITDHGFSMLNDLRSISQFEPIHCGYKIKVASSVSPITSEMFDVFEKNILNDIK
jgi:hypothetical protein